MTMPAAPPRPNHPMRGRDALRQQVYDRLTARGGLITLCGMGGVGKSRLATDVAQGWLEAHRPVVWVALDAVRHLHEAVATVADALGAERARDIGHILEERPRTLLVLDNLEQLEDSAFETVSGWVRDAPSLRVLTTSRRRLRVPEEEPVEVTPLDTPATSEVAASPAWAILTDHAGADATDMPPAQAAELIRATDGLPLAIELAAARFEVLTPDQVVQGSRSPLALLTDPDRPQTRHGSMRRALAWSWSLLSPTDAEVLSRLSVCRAPFDLETAEALAGFDGLVVDVLHRAVRAHLLVREGSTYRMLVTTRAYANEQLSDEARLDAAGRHTLHFGAQAMHLAERGEPRPAPAMLLAELAAIVERGPRDPSHTDSALHAGLLLSNSYRYLGEIRPMGTVAEQCLPWAVPDPETTARIRASLQCNRGIHLRSQGDYAGALSVYASIETREDWPTQLRSSVLQGTATCHALLGDVPTGIELLERADRLPDLDPHSQLEMQGTRAGWLMFVGRATEADALVRTIYSRGMELGPHLSVMLAFGFASQTIVAHDPELSMTLANQAVAWAEAGTNPYSLANLRAFRGIARHLAGDLDAAEADYRTSLRGLLAAEHFSVAAQVALDLARLRSELGHWAEARDLLAPHLDRLGSHTADHARAVLMVLSAMLGDDIVAADVPDDAGRAVVHLLVQGFRGSFHDAREAAEQALSTPMRCTDSAHARWLRSAIDQLTQRAGSWLIDRSGTWAEPPGAERIDLEKRIAYSRILAALLDARLTAPSMPLGVDTLFAAGWPGERVGASSLRNRVHVAISTLRKLGLEPLLRRHEGGWRLSADIPVVPFDPGAR